MIELYILLTLILVLLVMLGLRKKWKALLWSTAFILIIGITGCILFVYIFSEAFGAKCEDNRVWKIENYRIIEKQCIGFAGPYYNRVSLYENNKRIEGHSYMNDSSCIIKFKPDLTDTLIFDICDMTLEQNKHLTTVIF